MIEYAIEAALEWQPLVIASLEVARYLNARAGIRTIVNRSPDLGMAHSLRLADAALPEHVPIAVLLGDKPLVTRELIANVCEAAQDVDVAYPLNRLGEPGHPVVFSARARAKIRELPDGDSIKSLRDDPSFTKRTLLTDDAGAFFDVDTADRLQLGG